MAWTRLSSQIVAQATNAEVLLADLQLGVYYAIGGSGTEMWQAVDRGCSREQIICRLESIYEAPSKILDQALTDFLDNLVDFDLIKPSAAVAEPQSTHSPAPQPKRPFIPPVLSRIERSDPQLFELCNIRWVPANPVAWRCEAREVVLIQVNQGVKYTLSGTAKDIWLGLCAGHSRQALIDAFSNRFTLASEEVALNVDEFIVGLVQRGLLQPAHSEHQQLSSLSPADATVWETPRIDATEDKGAALKWISIHYGWEPAIPRIAAEMIENEVVIVDLTAGVYHSISGTATVLWQALCAGHVRDNLVRSLQDCFEVSAKEAEDEVDSVVGKLVERGLVRPRKSTESQPVQLPAPETRSLFEPSQITTYRDMEDVLRLDPVHDFEEYGWPNRA